MPRYHAGETLFGDPPKCEKCGEFLSAQEELETLPNKPPVCKRCVKRRKILKLHEQHPETEAEHSAGYLEMRRAQKEAWETEDGQPVNL